MGPACLFVGQDTEPGGLGALGDLPQHAESALIGLDGLGGRPARGDPSPDDRGYDEHGEHDDD
jgi:hypothetical protein